MAARRGTAPLCPYLFVIVNVRDANDRLPRLQPFKKNTYPLADVCPAATPGDMKDGYQPSNPVPLFAALHSVAAGYWEFSIICGAVQFCASRLVAVEKYHAATVGSGVPLASL